MNVGGMRSQKSEEEREARSNEQEVKAASRSPNAQCLMPNAYHYENYTPNLKQKEISIRQVVL